MNTPGSYQFKDVFPEYVPLDGHSLPESVSLGETGLLVDEQEHLLAFRGLQGAYDQDAAHQHNGDAPGINNAFYGPGLYAANTAAALRPLRLKGDRVMLRISPDAVVGDARTFGSAREVGGAALGFAVAAVKWSGMPPQVTHATFEHRAESVDALVVPPSATFQLMRPFSRQQLAEGQRVAPAWVVVRNPAAASVSAVQRRA